MAYDIYRVTCDDAVPTKPRRGGCRTVDEYSTRFSVPKKVPPRPPPPPPPEVPDGVYTIILPPVSSTRGTDPVAKHLT